MGHKVYTTYPEGSRFHLFLYHTETGDLLAIIEASWHGLLRTGAATGVATKYLARRDARSVGIIGSGAHARTQLEAVCAVRPIRRAHVYSPTPEHRRRFAAEMAASLDIEVAAVESAQEAVGGMDIVITATKSPAPVLRGDWLEPGAHLNAMGSNSLLRRELDPLSVERATLIVADSVEQLRLEGGDLLASIVSGKLRWGQIVPLGSIVAARHPGRQAESDITLFKSSGLGAQDVALGAVIYQRAVERGVGAELPESAR